MDPADVQGFVVVAQPEPNEIPPRNRIAEPAENPPGNEIAEGPPIDPTAKALTIKVILRKIFQHLPTPALHQCSLVNKQWKKESYKQLHGSRKWIVRISPKSPCRWLRALDERMRSMTLVPFNGLRLYINPYWYPCQCDGTLAPFANILNKLTLRHLALYIHTPPTRQRYLNSCATFRLAIDLLRQKMDQLETLNFAVYDCLQDYFPPYWPLNAAKNLKEISIPLPQTYHEDYRTESTFMERLTFSAPNLEEVSGFIDFERLTCIPEDKWECVKDFFYSNHLPGDLVDVGQRFLTKWPALRTLQVNDVVATLKERSYDGFLDELLRMSEMTLEEFRIRTFPFGSCRKFSLPKLRSLRVIKVDASDFETAVILANKLNENCKENLPLLDEFHLSVDPFVDEDWDGTASEISDDDDDEEFETIMAEYDYKHNFNIKKLRLDLDSRFTSFIALQQLFPAVTDLHISWEYYGKFARLDYGKIFACWPDLKQIFVESGGRDGSYALDAELCGLPEEDVDELEAKDDEYLQSVEIEPAFPCVFTLRHLQRLEIKYTNLRGGLPQGPCVSRVFRILSERYLPNGLRIDPKHTLLIN